MAGWLSGNCLGDEGACVLAPVLPRTRLTGLKLGGAYECRRVVVHDSAWLVLMLRLLQSIKTGNNISEEGVVELAAVLAQTQLKTLDLQCMYAPHVCSGNCVHRPQASSYSASGCA